MFAPPPRCSFYCTTNSEHVPPTCPPYPIQPSPTRTRAGACVFRPDPRPPALPPRLVAGPRRQPSAAGRRARHGWRDAPTCSAGMERAKGCRRSSPRCACQLPRGSWNWWGSETCSRGVRSWTASGRERRGRKTGCLCPTLKRLLRIFQAEQETFGFTGFRMRGRFFLSAFCVQSIN